MPWWSWILIWGGLVLALLVMLGYFAWRLFRKVMVTGHAVADLAAKAEILSSRAEELQSAQEHIGWTPAALQDPEIWRDVRDQQREDREKRKLIRRERRIARGRLIVRADPQRFSKVGRR